MNDSPCSTSFSFANIYPESVLRLSQTSGTLPPRGLVRISLSLNLKAPCSFYQRVYCLVKGGPHPLPLDVVATCTSETEYPARITQGHVNLEE